MNFQIFLAKVLDIANFPEEKKQKFLEIFYQYYFKRLVEVIGGVDPAYAQKLAAVVDTMRENPERFGELWREMMGNEGLKKVIEKVTDEVVGYLVDDVMKSSNENEKAQILKLVNG